MSSLSSIDPRIVDILSSTEQVTSGLNWGIIGLVIVLIIVICFMCSSIMFVFREQLYSVLKPRTIKVEGYEKSREMFYPYAE